MRYVFGDFELDTQRYELRLTGTPIALEPQGFNVLTYLVEQRERVVPKSELLERLWPNQYVSEAALTQRLTAVRRALGDDGRSQRYIRTVHGRGYRFVAAVTEHAITPPLSHVAAVEQPAWPQPASPRPGLFVGRETEMAQLQERLELALQGQRQVVLLGGEAGIGKSTLVDAFVAQVQSSTAAWIGRGQCIEHYGAGEAYLPLLEALGRLGRSPDGAPLVTGLRQQAPSWLPHLPGLLSEAEAAALPRQTPGLTRERMLRELADTLESLTATQPLLLVLEDLHWSDVSTVDWLSYVARRRDPARLMILGTYRPGDVLLHQHPLHAAVQELHRQKQALDVPLPYWTVAEVTTYLVQRFGALPFAGPVIQLFHQRTQGNPFFLVALVEAMASQGALEQAGVDIGVLAAAIPASIRHLIDYQFDALAPDDQALLEVASVAGEAFATAEVATVLGHTVDAIEARCDTLARKGQFIYDLGLDTWPDGTVVTRYGFRHALYHDVLYERLALGQRLRCHRQLGVYKERAYGVRAAEIAAELAMHFVRGQDAPRGVQYLSAAAQQALQRCAYQEALQHVEQAFGLVPQLPEGPARTQQTLGLYLNQGRALIITQGYAAAGVEEAYRQAYHLGQQLGDTPALFPVLDGLRSFYNVRADYQTALTLAERCLRIAQTADDGGLLAQVRCGLASTLFFLGQLVSTRQTAMQGLASHDTMARNKRTDRYTLQDAQVSNLLLTSSTLWYLGYPEQAQQWHEQLLVWARQLGDPFNLALGLFNGVNLAHLNRQSAATQHQAEALMALTTEHGIPHWRASAAMIRSWALVMQHREPQALAGLQQALAGYRASGAVMVLSQYLAMLADAYGALRQPDQGLEALREAFAMVEQTGEIFYAAELHRLQGELMCMQPTAAARLASAETCFLQALEVARSQESRMLELRAAVSLGRLWRQQGKREAARHLVDERYRWFTEGFDTVDLQQARAFLEERDAT